MRPQYFPWLFDDRNAWEKSFADPRYSYELPIDCFMSLYQVERKVDTPEQVSMPMFAMPTMPLPTASAPAPIPFAAAPVAVAPAVAEPPPKEEKHEEGILSQDEIDALLSGL